MILMKTRCNLFADFCLCIIGKQETEWDHMDVAIASDTHTHTLTNKHCSFIQWLAKVFIPLKIFHIV